MKLPRLKGRLRKPKTAQGRKSLVARDFFRRQQIEKRGGLALCNVYVFSDTNPDKLTLGSAFTGNLRVQIASDSEVGLNPAIVAGRIGSFVASTDVQLEPVWNRYEIEAVALTYIVDETFNGRVAYAKDGVWYYLDMGPLSTSLLLINGDALLMNGQTVINSLGD